MNKSVQSISKTMKVTNCGGPTSVNRRTYNFLGPLPIGVDFVGAAPAHAPK